MPCSISNPSLGILEGKKLRNDRMYDPNRHPRRMYRYTTSHVNDLDTDEPQMYKIYCRMCGLRHKTCHVKDKVPATKQKEKFELNLPTASEFPRILTHDHLRCRCYENSLKVIRDLDHKTVATPVRHEKPKYIPDRLMNQVWTSYLLNEQTQLPLSTLVVRWQLRRYIPSYDMHELHTILSCYGKITAIYQQSPNSAMVIFDNITSACRVMQTRQLGQLRNKIHCAWWHRYMTNKSFYTTRKGLSIKVDPFVQLLN